MKEKRKLGFLCCFWGDWHRNALIHASLASIFYSNAFESIMESFDVKFFFHTTEDDLSKLQETVTFKAFCEKYSCSFSFLDLNQYDASDQQNSDEMKTGNMFRFWSQGLNNLIQQVGAEGRDFFFLHPDCMYNDAFFLHFLESVERGIKVLGCPSLRIDAESIAEVYPMEEVGFAYSHLSHKRKIHFALEHLNICHRREFPFEQNFTRWPSSLFFDMGDGRLIMRTYSDNVWFYFAHEVGHHEIEGNLDWEYDERCFNKAQEQFGDAAIRYFYDFERGFIVSITPKDHYTESHFLDHGGYKSWNVEFHENPSPLAVCAWFRASHVRYNKEFYSFKHNVLINPTEQDDVFAGEPMARMDAFCEMFVSLSECIHRGGEFAWVDAFANGTLIAHGDYLESVAKPLALGVAGADYISEQLPGIQELDAAQIVGANDIAAYIYSALERLNIQATIFDDSKAGAAFGSHVIRGLKEIALNTPVIICAISDSALLEEQLGAFGLQASIYNVTESIYQYMS